MTPLAEVIARERREKRRAYHLRAVAKARESRRELIRRLGGKCASPGCEATEQLEVEHVNGREWNLRHPDYVSRIKRYWKEYEAGIELAALCRTHNAQKNGSDPRVRAAVRRRNDGRFKKWEPVSGVVVTERAEKGDCMPQLESIRAYIQSQNAPPKQPIPPRPKGPGLLEPHR